MRGAPITISLWSVHQINLLLGQPSLFGSGVSIQSPENLKMIALNSMSHILSSEMPKLRTLETTLSLPLSPILHIIPTLARARSLTMLPPPPPHIVMITSLYLPTSAASVACWMDGQSARGSKRRHPSPHPSVCNVGSVQTSSL